jgi:hypothetical protein
MKMLKLSHLAAALAATLISATCWAETAVFQEGISDANGPNPAYNMDVGYMTSGYGGPLQANDANHQIGGLNGAYGRAVLRWDLSSLAGKGTVSGATAKLTFEPVVRAEGTATAPDPFTYNLYRLTSANAQWTDAGVGNTQQRLGPSVPWAGSAGASTPGVDYFTTPVAQATITGGNDTTKKVLTFTFTDTSFLQDWVDNPANNAGFLLKSEALETAGGYPNNANGGYAQGTLFPDDVTTAPGRYPGAVAADRPILEVTYQVPEPASAISLLAGSFMLIARRRSAHMTKSVCI